MFSMRRKKNEIKTQLGREVHTEMSAGEVRAIERDEEHSRCGLWGKFKWVGKQCKLIEVETEIQKDCRKKIRWKKQL